MNEDPAPTPEEQEQTPEELPGSQAAEGSGFEDDDLPGEDEPAA